MAKFQAAARALDMLGRQQIAGIPTAISELFKNAHDAYADQAVVDYYHKHNLFILRDDGIGMTQEEFEQRWLTIGTDSKMSGGRIGMPYVPSDKGSRATMGEKGIGRLAVGLIGNQLLVLTRAKRGETLHDLVAAFINWDVFSWPSVGLHEIEIPVKTFPGGLLPTIPEIESLVSDFREGISQFRDRVSDEQYSAVTDSLDRFSLPTKLENFGKPSLAIDGHGTHFFIQPTSEMVEADLVRDSAGASQISRYLVGFTNTMSPHHEKPDIVTKFREFETDDQPIEVIGENTFWSPYDFAECDHSFVGTVDEFGVFEGDIRIFEKDFHRKVAWKNVMGRPTECGPFKFCLGAIQGDRKDSLLPSDIWSIFKERLDRQAGIYIYRDGLRILPYGNSDVDWLNIEKRRTNSAKHYYFSYRNLFGCVELTKRENPGMLEKAGREGFRDNKAYREMKDILENLFLYFATEFFRKDAKESYYDERRDALNAQARADERRQKRKSTQQEKFLEGIGKVVEEFKAGDISREILEILAQTELSAGLITDADPDSASKSLLKLETDNFTKLKGIESKLTLARPRGFGLNKTQTKTYDEYSFKSRFTLENEVLPARRKVSEIVSSRIHDLGISVDRNLRLESTVASRITEIKGLESKERLAAQETLSGLSKTVRDLLQDNHSDLVARLDNLWTDLIASDVTRLSDEEFDQLIDSKTSELDQVEQGALGVCRLIRDTVARVQLIRNSSGELESSLEEEESMDTKLDALSEQVEEDFELVQLGLAFDIIDHEFVDKISTLGRSLERIERWANSRTETKDAYRSLKASFNHLENYLVLFTPLRRRANVTPTNIEGKQVADFIEGVFEERLKKTGVELRITPKFRSYVWSGLRSVFYPAFLNIVDNAIYWTDRHPQRDKDGNALPGVVELDYDGKKWLISDNGPGIDPFERDKIFDLRYFNKPGGRGLGLFITKKVLGDAGYGVHVANHSVLGGATFVIEQLQDDSE